MPVTLATLEAEIGRILVQGQPQQKVFEILPPSQPIKKTGHGGTDQSGKVWRMCQVVAHLPSKHKALSSSPNATK
jgi:hypothetical protein